MQEKTEEPLEEREARGKRITMAATLAMLALLNVLCWLSMTP